MWELLLIIGNFWRDFGVFSFFWNCPNLEAKFWKHKEGKVFRGFLRILPKKPTPMQFFYRRILSLLQYYKSSSVVTLMLLAL